MITANYRARAARCQKGWWQWDRVIVSSVPVTVNHESPLFRRYNLDSTSHRCLRRRRLDPCSAAFRPL